jgi:hypothetical protein
MFLPFHCLPNISADLAEPNKNPTLSLFRATTITLPLRFPEFQYVKECMTDEPMKLTKTENGKELNQQHFEDEINAWLGAHP